MPQAGMADAVTITTRVARNEVGEQGRTAHKSGARGRGAQHGASMAASSSVCRR